MWVLNLGLLASLKNILKIFLSFGPTLAPRITPGGYPGVVSDMIFLRYQTPTCGCSIWACLRHWWIFWKYFWVSGPPWPPGLPQGVTPGGHPRGGFLTWFFKVSNPCMWVLYLVLIESLVTILKIFLSFWPTLASRFTPGGHPKGVFLTRFFKVSNPCMWVLYLVLFESLVTILKIFLSFGPTLASRVTPGGYPRGGPDVIFLRYQTPTFLRLTSVISGSCTHVAGRP